MKSVFGMQRKLACMANHKGRFFTPFNDVTVMKDDPVYKASVSAASGPRAAGQERTGSPDLWLSVSFSRSEMDR